MGIINNFKKINNGPILLIGDFLEDDKNYICDAYKIVDKGKIKEFLIKNYKQKKLIDVLSYVGLNINDLENDEINWNIRSKLQLALGILSKENIVYFNNINIGLNNKEKDRIKRIIKKLSEKKAVFISSNDSEFLINLVNEVCIINKENETYKLNSINWYDDELYNYLDVPAIVDFVQFLNLNNIKMEKHLETKEVLKSIYRSVKK